jgi:tRNA A-37 threonylcarbamoyl transferase component Bud32
MHAVMGTGRLIAGRYRLHEPIGRGAMGIVWHGRDELLDRDVAVKEVQITTQASPADAEVLYQRTLREARTAARLSHPSVVKVFDVVEEGGSPWIVMELVDARSLDQVITEDGPLPPEQAADLGTSLISALSTAHRAGVLHRDVKPSNVLVTKDGQAVLTDFGIATFAEDRGLTQAGMVVGTPGFTAPERIRGDVATPASDLWSLGATLYAAVEGRGPFDRVGGSSVITAGVATEDAPRAPSAGPLGPVIDALLSRDPGTRPDAAAAAKLLADAATAARTGPRQLRDGWLAAEAEAGTEDAPGPAAAGRLSAEDSGFLDPPDYEVLQIPADQEEAPAEDAAGPEEKAGTVAAAGAAGAVAAAALASAEGGAARPAAAAGVGPAAASLDPSSGPALWGPVKGPGSQPGAGQPADSGPAGAGPSGPSGPGKDGGSGSGGDGPFGALGRAWRSSGRWRLLVAGAGIAAIVVAAIIGWNIFQHSAPVSALGSFHPGTGGQVNGSAPASPGTHRGASGHKSSSHSGSGNTGSGGSSSTHGGTPAGTGHSGKPSTGPGGNPSGNPSGGGPSKTPGGGSPTPTPSPTPSATPTPTPTPSTSSTPPGTTLPSGWKWHRFGPTLMAAIAGFKIGMPNPWVQSASGQVAHLNQPARDFHLAVNLGYWTYAKPLREAQYLQNQAAKAHKHGYRVILLTSIGFKVAGGYRSGSAAELKFTWYNPTLATHYTQFDLLITLSTSAGSQPYAFALWAPSGTFGAANGVFHTALATFRPLPA